MFIYFLLFIQIFSKCVNYIMKYLEVNAFCTFIDDVFWSVMSDGQSSLIV